MEIKADKRDSGIPFVGDLSWGTHLCQFYQTEKDLLDILVPYFRAGLEGNEFCVWVTSEFLTTERALGAMEATVPGFPDYRAKGQVEIFPRTDWYLKGEGFDVQRVLAMWQEKYNEALAKGFEGMRVTGNVSWNDNGKDWENLAFYESAVNEVIGGMKVLALCTYSLEKCGSVEIQDVVKHHEFILAVNQGVSVLSG